MKIKFIPQNIEVEGTPEKTLLQIANENHIEIKSICKGVPSCAECRVKIKEGDSFVTPPSKAEIGLIGTSYYIDGRRLSCQVRCFGPVTVDLSEQISRDQLQNKKIRGFRSAKNVESKAVQDTLLLSEKKEIAAGPSSDDQKPNQNQNSGGNSNNNQHNNNQNHRNHSQGQNRDRQNSKSNRKR